LDLAIARKKIDDPFLRSTLHAMFFLQGDQAGMEKQVSWAMGKPGIEDVLLSTQSDTEAYFGRLNKSRELTRRAVESSRHNDAKETAALNQSVAATREAIFGNSAAARQQADAALALASNRDIETLCAFTYAWIGDSSRAQTLADKLNKDFPVATMTQSYWLPIIRGSMEIGHNSPDKAVEILRTAEPFDLAGATPIGSLFPAYVRGQAYLQAHRGAEAAAEFQKLLEHRGVVSNFAMGALAHLGLGRAYAVQGDTAHARAAYQDFFGIWKDADADVPILVAAKAEYAKLK
jgi:eukaryotic-like serine/threonine-protein kinase